MTPTEETLLPVPSPRSLADGPPSGRIAGTSAVLLAAAGLVLLIAGARRDMRPLTIAGSMVSALALGAILYWRAALISYWQLVPASAPADGPTSPATAIDDGAAGAGGTPPPPTPADPATADDEGADDAAGTEPDASGAGEVSTGAPEV